MNKNFIIILLFILAGRVFSQYTIKDFNYDIKGATNPFFLELKLGIDKNMTFETLEEIEDFRKKLDQQITNLRVFEKQNIYTIIENNQVTFVLELKDAWNVLAIPYPKYSTQDGGRIAAKVYWNNTLGTLTNSLFTGGLNIGLNNNNQLQLQTWDFSAVAQGIAILNKFYDFSLVQNLNLLSRDKDSWRFYRTQIGSSTSFGPFWGLNYGVSLSIGANYGYESYSGIKIEDIPKNPFDLTYAHSLGRSDINWKGNFRDGYSYSLGNSISLNWGDNVKPTTSLSLTVNYYKPLWELPLAIGHQLFGSVSFNNEMLGLGSNLRGVEDGSVYGNQALFAKNNLYVRVIKIEGLAEAIFAPFFDIGLTDMSGLKYGTGADFILYVDKLKSLVARGTVGWDLEDFDISKVDIEITSNLFF